MLFFFSHLTNDTSTEQAPAHWCLHFSLKHLLKFMTGNNNNNNNSTKNHDFVMLHNKESVCEAGGTSVLQC